MTSPIFVLQTERMASSEYKSMQELAEELNQYLAAIDEGSGDVDRLEEMVNHARELYERLVVMRHKAFEDVVEEKPFVMEAMEPRAKEEEVGDEADSEENRDEPPSFSIGTSVSSKPISLGLDLDEGAQGKPSDSESPQTGDKPEEEVVLEQADPLQESQPNENQEEESPSFSIGMGVTTKPVSLGLDLDDGVTQAPADSEGLVSERENESEAKPEPPATPENQTSLIDAIEEISGESVAEKYESQNDSESLVEKLERAPITDLVSAISLNQKFLFIKELFAGDNERYLAEIESFNNMDSWDSAKKVLASLDKELGWEDGEALEEFAELIQRRHSN